MIWLMISLATLAVGPEAEGKAMTDVARATNAFALDLYGKVRDRPGNAFLSPYSISTALAMAYAGARGETADQMARVLHLGGDPEATHRGFAALMASLNGGEDAAGRGYRLNVANRLWGNDGFHFLPEFLELTRARYGAGLERIDFARSAEAVATINAWISGKTQGKIKDLLQPGDVNARTRLVLTNAIYFKGTWADPFAKGQTRDDPFHLTTAAAAKVPTMHRLARHRFFEGDGLKVLELPYGPGDLAMDVILPDAVDGLPALEARLTADNLGRWLAGLGVREVDVSLPKFTMTSRFELGEALKKLGMTRAFSDEETDFSGIATEEELAISAVIHQAFVDVNEEGTEAAAATAITIRATAAVMPRPPATFRADHPFLFLIRDVRSGSILFLGRVADPRG